MPLALSRAIGQKMPSKETMRAENRQSHAHGYVRPNAGRRCQCRNPAHLLDNPGRVITSRDMRDCPHCFSGAMSSPGGLQNATCDFRFCSNGCMNSFCMPQRDFFSLFGCFGFVVRRMAHRWLFQRLFDASLDSDIPMNVPCTLRNDTQQQGPNWVRTSLMPQFLLWLYRPRAQTVSLKGVVK